MRISEIRLCNIGPYLGENEIPLCCDDGRNIVLIGGKNGAGKTTLFDAARLCLCWCPCKRKMWRGRPYAELFFGGIN